MVYSISFECELSDNVLHARPGNSYLWVVASFMHQIGPKGPILSISNNFSLCPTSMLKAYSWSSNHLINLCVFTTLQCWFIWRRWGVIRIRIVFMEGWTPVQLNLCNYSCTFITISYGNSYESYECEMKSLLVLGWICYVFKLSVWNTCSIIHLLSPRPQPPPHKSNSQL